MLRRVVLSLILIPLVLGAGFGAYKVLVALRKAPTPRDLTPPALAVSTITLRPQTITAVLDGFGTAQAERSAVLGAEVAGQVVELPANIRAGAAVAAGDVLLKIDERQYSAALAQVEALIAGVNAGLDQLRIEEANVARLIETVAGEMTVAEREYQRILDLFERGQSNDREVDAARVVVQRARRALTELETQQAVIPARRAQQEAQRAQFLAQRDTARLNVEHCTLRAPFDGRISRVDVELGEQVAPGRALLALLDPWEIEIPLELPMAARAQVREGAAVKLALSSDPATVWSGSVARIAPEANNATRTFALYVELDNRRQATPLLPGMFVRAEVAGPLLTDVLLVPRTALREQRIYVAVDGRAAPRQVEVVRTLREQAVVAGLPAGTVVITSNFDALYDGAPIAVRAAEAASPAPSATAAQGAAAPRADQGAGS